MIVSNPSIKFDPTNKAEGADVSVKNGDHVSQKAYWDAGGAGAKAEKYSKAEGGKAYSNGDQSSESGHNKSDVDANTKAVQDNWLGVDQSQTRDGRHRRRRRRPQQGGRWRHPLQGQHRIRQPERRRSTTSKYFHIDDFRHVQLIDTCEGWDRRPSAAGSQFVAKPTKNGAEVSDFRSLAGPQC